jgi:pyoverdine/dityrosine biosynthesis protein Dit1
MFLVQQWERASTELVLYPTQKTSKRNNPKDNTYKFQFTKTKQKIMQQVEQIVNVFQDFRMQPLPIDQFEELGKPALIDKMMPYISKNEPIRFTMLGYPMKSPNNRDKVLGTLPDLGEEVSLKNFGTFDKRIREVYEPGVNVTVISDGYVFSDLMEVSDDIVTEYHERNMEFTAGMPVQWYDLRDFYSKRMGINEMRDKVMGQFGITEEELERRIMFDPDVKSLYLGMIKFMNLDIAIRNFPSKSQLQQAAKKLARQMMLRNEAYSNMIRTEFGDHVRLSMHPSVNNGTKFSFQLIPSPKAWTSPWHSALLVNNDGELETIHKKDALEKGYQIVNKDGQPYYFTANN